MKLGKRVVYIGSEVVFRGLEGTLIEAEDRSKHSVGLHFQPDSNAIAAVPCAPEDVRAV
jgi:hypothetical protein